MRIAALVIGVVFGIGLFVQSVIVAAITDESNEQFNGADAGTGIIIAVLMIVAGGVAIPLPRLALVLFAIAGIMALTSAGPMEFPDLYIYGTASLVLSVFSFFGYHGKQEEEQREYNRQWEYRQAVLAQQQMAEDMRRLRQQSEKSTYLN